MEKNLGHRVGLATSYTLLGLHYGQRAEIDEDRRAELEAQGRGHAQGGSGAQPGPWGARRRWPQLTVSLPEIVDRRGNLDQVEATLKDAQALHKKLGDERSMARLYSSLGHGRNKRGDKAQACAYWRKGALAYPDDARARGRAEPQQVRHAMRALHDRLRKWVRS